MKPDIVLVTPVYRDSKRLASFGPSLARAFAGGPQPVLWVVADDGSGEAEVGRITDLIEDLRKIYPRIELYEKGKHLGKGGTVRSAWKAYADAKWLAFVDADGSVSAEGVLALIEKALAAGPGHAVLASRIWTPETVVTQKPLRKLTHRAFAAIGRLLLGLPVWDLQCGAKLVDSSSFRAVAQLLEEDGFAFDAELLVALERNGTRLLEVPVDWAEKGGGSLNPFFQAWPMLMALFRVCRRRSAGRYDPSSVAGAPKT